MTIVNEGLSDAYWDGTRRNELVLQRCDSCGTVRHYPRLLCSTCYSFDWSPVTSSSDGTIHSWTIAHHVFDPSVTTEVPYTLVTVDMSTPDGAARVRVLGRLDPELEPSVGLPVRLRFAPVPTFGTSTA